MSFRIVPIAFAVLLLAGCAGSSKVMLGQARAPIDPAQVQIYRTPPAGALEIAQLESKSAVGFGTQGQTDAAVARLRAKMTGVELTDDQRDAFREATKGVIDRFLESAGDAGQAALDAVNKH